MMAYVKASICLAKELKRLEDKESSNSLETSEFLIPLLFNVRHCIELLLKFLSYGTPEPPQYTHNISTIFNNFQTYFEKLDKPQLSLIAKHLQISTTDVGNAFKGFMIRLEGITNKYYGFTFLVDGVYLIEDKKNEMFRYPVNFSADFEIDLEKLHLKISADEILDDLWFLFNQALVFMYTFTTTKEGSPVFVALRHWAKQGN